MDNAGTKPRIVKMPLPPSSHIALEEAKRYRLEFPAFRVRLRPSYMRSGGVVIFLTFIFICTFNIQQWKRFICFFRCKVVDPLFHTLFVLFSRFQMLHLCCLFQCRGTIFGAFWQQSLTKRIHLSLNFSIIKELFRPAKPVNNIICWKSYCDDLPRAYAPSSWRGTSWSLGRVWWS